MTTSADKMTDANGNPEEPLEGVPADTARPDAEDHAPEATEEEPDTFPRSYVEELRQENGKYRQRAQRADDLAHRLHKSLVASTGRLQDPEDLEFNEDHLDDPEALTAAVDDLLQAKPHLAPRRPRGDVGQGITSAPTDTVDLAGILRSRAS